MLYRIFFINSNYKSNAFSWLKLVVFFVFFCDCFNCSRVTHHSRTYQRETPFQHFRSRRTPPASNPFSKLALESIRIWSFCPLMDFKPSMCILLGLESPMIAERNTRLIKDRHLIDIYCRRVNVVTFVHSHVEYVDLFFIMSASFFYRRWLIVGGMVGPPLFRTAHLLLGWFECWHRHRDTRMREIEIIKTEETKTK